MNVFDWTNLDREEICYGTTRVLRIVRIGRTFFVEQAKLERDEDSERVVWSSCAVAKDPDPRKAYLQAIQFLVDANIAVLKMRKES